MHIRWQDDFARSFDMTATLGYSRSGDSKAHEFIRSRNGRHSADGLARRAARGRLQRPAERACGAGGGDSTGGSRRTRPDAVTRAGDDRNTGGNGGHSHRHRALYAVRNDRAIHNRSTASNGSAIRNGNGDVDPYTCGD